jgi:hypothetical protein
MNYIGPSIPTQCSNQLSYREFKYSVTLEIFISKNVYSFTECDTQNPDIYQKQLALQ